MSLPYGKIPAESECWSAGELADAVGVTVRTLHHYDEIGLLTPAGRSGSGHRRYEAPQVERLYRILALRSLGFDLPAIGRALDSRVDSGLLETARFHLQEARDRLRSKLVAGIASFTRGRSSPPRQKIGVVLGVAMFAAHIEG